MMQIRELVLYSRTEKVRRLKFKLGQVNIITGKSKSGKSAVGDIIEYCMGGGSCNIADGVIRDNVLWYGLLLQFDNERAFVARKNPEIGQQSTSLCYTEVGEQLETPEFCNFTANTNVEGLEEFLTKRIGISENLFNPPEGQSRNPLAANIRHAMFYCFQGQDEIAAKNFLFHHQSEDFISQAIKDTMPYFLGIISEDALALEDEKGRLKRNLTLEKRKLEENRLLQGGGTERAIALISEAQRVGIFNFEKKIEYGNYNALYSLLQDIESWKPDTVPYTGMDRLSFLQNQLVEERKKLEEVDFELSNAKEYMGETAGYSGEIQHQKKRLESIGLFDNLDFNPGVCPLCSGLLKQPLPEIDAIKTAILNLDKSIANVNREQPKLRMFIDSLETERGQIMETIKSLEADIDGIYNQEQEAKNIRDLNTRRAKVVGRISLWLESVAADTESEKREAIIQDLEKRLHEIEEILDRDSIEERKQSALSRIQVDMSNWAKELQLEHCDNPYRLDMGKVTVVVDKTERPVPLKQLGSGSNWVGVHLIALFALQKYFITANRPVPNFIFLDQPSQVYFPSELDEKQIDWNEVDRLYRFIASRVKEAEGKLQVIIVDHADLKDDLFQKMLIEKWWSKEKNLIPEDWYK